MESNPFIAVNMEFVPYNKNRVFIMTLSPTVTFEDKFFGKVASVGALTDISMPVPLTKGITLYAVSKLDKSSLNSMQRSLENTHLGASVDLEKMAGKPITLNFEASPSLLKKGATTNYARVGLEWRIPTLWPF
jgi:hypothetical protein